MSLSSVWAVFKHFLAVTRKVWSYLCNLQWNETVQFPCIFCAHDDLKPVYQDDMVVAFENIRLAGKQHWLISPKEHIRDIENLDPSNIPLLRHFDKIKHQLLKEHCPSHESVTVLCGYHRGRRPLFGETFWPDIVSIHHLHLHVIVEPRLLLRLFKYPAWLPLMWKTDEQVLRQVEKMRRKTQ